MKRELPRIPLAPDFWAFSKAGRELADLHLNYETAPEYPLKETRTGFDLRVEKMRYKDKTTIIYNDSITLEGIPLEAHEYRLGNRSALDWIVDQYRVKTDRRSGIVNDPNRDDGYILSLIKRVTFVSLETVKIVNELVKLQYK